MFDIGFLELILIAIISLLVLGPERLPVAARTAGRWIGKARRMVNQFSREIDRQIEVEELRKQLKEQGESLNIDEDVQNIQKTVQAALDEAKGNASSHEYEPLPREEIEASNAPTENTIHGASSSSEIDTKSSSTK